ncbi:hypothetical protein NC653_006115 [Populus alba x Populus x berolinensis]|uniref:Uncharacterized protein n=1 Tax=Populus alba x Populus x berolinensis TaxID=444605 RepID=A0AAD6RDT0_9ROSI|nr:hypothetical protein NC653_006109 [Populus alba x Populus x berolinensis]KAJ7006954.1 hypothetical protein NC653_006115 [Populus alba x Populus x berolinensis]
MFTRLRQSSCDIVNSVPENNKPTIDWFLDPEIDSAKNAKEITILSSRASGELEKSVFCSLCMDWERSMGKVLVILPISALQSSDLGLIAVC